MFRKAIDGVITGWKFIGVENIPVVNNVRLELLKKAVESLGDDKEPLTQAELAKIKIFISIVESFRKK